MPKAYLSWSSGKDSAYALFEARRQARRQGLVDIVGLITTTNEAFNRVAMHGTRNELLDRQIAATGLPCLKVPLPWPCSNAEYESRMARAMDQIAAQGVRHMVFGDLFLQDIRAYRDEKLAAIGMQAIYPLWGRDTAALARSMIDDGLVAHLVTVDPSKLDTSFAGRRFDAALLADLPASVDPCGENGEFHTVVVAGPMFSAPIDVCIGDVVERDGFVYADVIPT